MPDSIVESMQDGAGGPFAYGTGTQNVVTTQSWYTALPNDVRSYLSSVVQEERTLVQAGVISTNAVKGGAVAKRKTLVPMVMLLAVLVGVLIGL
jgi:hypothetical protein